MSSAKQKQIENVRYPHVKRNWIKAIKAIRNGGGIQKRIYLVEHQSGLDANQKRQRVAQDAGGWIQHPVQEHLLGKTNKDKLRSVERSGFSQSSSSDRLTDEQKEDLIAENIYDWWISGKSYKKWYTDKFLQLKFDLSEDNET